MHFIQNSPGLYLTSEKLAMFECSNTKHYGKRNLEKAMTGCRAPSSFMDIPTPALTIIPSFCKHFFLYPKLTLCSMVKSTTSEEGKQRLQAQGFNIIQRTLSNQGKLGMREVLLPRKEHSNWVSSAEWSFLKTLYGLSML